MAYRNYRYAYGGGVGYRKASGYNNAATYGRGGYGSARRRSGWPKGKKNCNAWGRVVKNKDGVEVFLGGAWLYDFRRRTLFKVDITPKYSRKTGNGEWESVEPNYETENGRMRFKVKCEVTNTRTFQKMYGTSIYNPDSGKIYFENLDLMININKRTACFQPFSKEYRPNYRKGSYNR